MCHPPWHPVFPPTRRNLNDQLKQHQNVWREENHTLEDLLFFSQSVQPKYMKILNNTSLFLQCAHFMCYWKSLCSHCTFSLPIFLEQIGKCEFIGLSERTLSLMGMYPAGFDFLNLFLFLFFQVSYVIDSKQSSKKNLCTKYVTRVISHYRYNTHTQKKYKQTTPVFLK